VVRSPRSGGGPIIRIPVPLALVVVAVIGAACSGEEGTRDLPTPSSAFPSESTGATGIGSSGATGGESGQTSGPSGLPTTSPALATGNLTDGELRYELTGAIQLSKTLPVLVTAVYSPPPGGLAIVWTAGGTDASTVGIGGTSFVGTRPTAPTLSLSITAQSADGLWTFLSLDGECDVTIDVAEPGVLAGGFRCAELVSDEGLAVGVSASFEAEG
jgi:hypothetical protein